MRDHSWIAASVGLVAAAYIVIGVVWFAPWCLASLFRYRLWKLRDRIVDDIYQGETPDLPLFHQQVEMIEWYIRHAEKVTFFRFATLSIMFQEDLKSFDSEYEGMLASLIPVVRSKFEAYSDEFTQAAFTHVLRGSISGWFAAVLLFPIGMVVALFARRSPIDRAKKQSERLQHQIARDERLRATFGTDDRPLANFS